MAIGRISGAMLFSDLDRQGQDLAFTTNGNALIYQNFNQFLVGINTDTPTRTLTVDGNVSLANVVIFDNVITTDNGDDLYITPSGNVFLKSIENIKIPGGASGYLLQTDGTGNLNFVDIITTITSFKGNAVQIGIPYDKSLTANAAYPVWTESTTVTDALDNLNQVMFNVFKGTFIQSVDFTSNIQSGASPSTVQFTPTVVGNANAYIWDFGDGTTSTSQTPTKTYNNTSGGQFTVTVRAYNTGGTFNGNLENNAQGSVSQTIKSNYFQLYTPTPIASFSLSATSGDTPRLLGLTNTSQFASSYEIYWGDGTTSNVATNSSDGGPTGAAKDHTYTSATADTKYNVILTANSITSGPGLVSANSSPTSVRVYRTHSPAFTNNTATGNNLHTFFANGTANIVGHSMTFTNTTATNPGVTTDFPVNNYKWDWGDGTSANINIGSSTAGDTSVPIAHSFKLSDPTVQETFNVRLQVYNGHSTSPFSSANTTVTVNPAPTAQYTANATVISNKTGDTSTVGYLYTDLNGVDRANIGFYNQSYNTTHYQFDYGDGSSSANINTGPGTPSTYLYYTYSSTGTFTTNLTAVGPNSTSSSDDKLTRTNYITIQSAPSAPAGLSSYSATMNYNTASVGTNPLLAASATDNSASGTPVMPGAGSTVNRITTATTLTTPTFTNVYNAAAGYLRSFFNNTIDGNVTFDINNNSGTYGNIVVTSDVDSNTISPGTYPSNFYQVWSGYHTKPVAQIPVGYNALTLQHTTTGNVSAGVVKDDVTDVPTIYTGNVTMGVSTLGTPTYISGVPYFNTGGAIYATGIEVYDWIGQTYRFTFSPFSFQPGTNFESTSGSILSSQAKTYSQLDGPVTYLSGGNPIANTGKTSATRYTLGNLSASINGSVRAVSNINVIMNNVNGTGTAVALPKKVNTYALSITGFDETNISCSSSLGSGFTDAAKRIFISGASGANPTISSSTNYYTGSLFTGAIAVSGTDEATVRWGTLLNDTTDWSAYLPPGPTARASGTQYIRIAFRRQTMSNFKITYSGKISGLWVAAPGTQIDNTSTLNKWLDGASTYLGFGIPGANTGSGGNGSNGCAKTSGDVVPVGTTVTNRACSFTLGAENASNSYGNQVIINIAIAAGDSLTALSIGP
jgi:hypothetical protein